MEKIEAANSFNQNTFNKHLMQIEYTIKSVKFIGLSLYKIIYIHW